MPSLAPRLSPLKLARRERLLDVAERLFTAQGFRATSMEGLAEAAGLSKVTVYHYFRDKDAAFQAVAARLAERMRAAVLDRLRGDAPLAERIAQALIAKHGMVHDVVRSSAFASDLMAQKATVGRIFADLDLDLVRAIGDAAGDVQAARILFNAALGIANASGSKPEMEADIERLVGDVLR